MSKAAYDFSNNDYNEIFSLAEELKFARYDFAKIEDEIRSLEDKTCLLQRVYQARSDYLLAVALNDSVFDVFKAVYNSKTKVN